MNGNTAVELNPRTHTQCGGSALRSSSAATSRCAVGENIPMLNLTLSLTLTTLIADLQILVGATFVTCQACHMGSSVHIRLELQLEKQGIGFVLSTP